MRVCRLTSLIRLRRWPSWRHLRKNQVSVSLRSFGLRSFERRTGLTGVELEEEAEFGDVDTADTAAAWAGLEPDTADTAPAWSEAVDSGVVGEVDASAENEVIAELQVEAIIRAQRVETAKKRMKNIFGEFATTDQMLQRSVNPDLLEPTNRKSRGPDHQLVSAEQIAAVSTSTEPAPAVDAVAGGVGWGVAGYPARQQVVRPVDVEARVQEDQPVVEEPAADAHAPLSPTRTVIKLERLSPPALPPKNQIATPKGRRSKFATPTPSSRSDGAMSSGRSKPMQVLLRKLREKKCL